MADTEENTPYVNPFKPLADKATANQEAWLAEQANKARQQEAAQTMGYQMGRRGQWDALLNALMGQKKKRQIPQIAMTQLPELDMNSWGGR